MKNGEYKIIMVKCTCGRVKVNGEFVRPKLEQLETIGKHIDEILFRDETCPKCGERKSE